MTQAGIVADKTKQSRVTSDKISKKYLTNIKKCYNMLIRNNLLNKPQEELNMKHREPFVLALAKPIKKLY